MPSLTGYSATPMKKRHLVVLLGMSLSLSCALPRLVNPLAIPTATPTLAPGVTPPPTFPPTLTPSPTPEPAARVDSGDAAFFNGDWDKALFEYSFALQANDDPQLQAAALLGLGHTYNAIGNHGAALDSLRNLIDNYAGSIYQANAYFALGETYSGLQRYSEAAAAYQQYLTLRPGVVDHYAQSRMGDALYAAGGYQGAINAYLSALQAPRLSDGLDIQVRIGNAYAELGDHSTALVTYQDVYARTSNDFVKAQMDYLIGQTYVILGQPDAGHTAYLDAVNNYPLSVFAYNSLIALVEANVPVDELQRGIVDYYAGQYGLAIAALDRYVTANPDSHTDEAHYYKALALLNQGQYTDAIAVLDEQITTHAGEAYWVSAFEEKAFIQWNYLEQYAAAAQTLLDFVALNPNAPSSAEFLFTAGKILEIGNDLGGAAQTLERVGSEYPASEFAYDSVFLAGIVRYRMGDLNAALTDFQNTLGMATDRYNQAKSFFWIGKTQFAQSNLDGARISWEQAASLDPTGYYSERAADLLAGRAPFAPPTATEFNYPALTERAQAEDWLRTTFGLPPETDLSGPGPLAGDPRFVRGTELWELGLYEEARLEFESLRADVEFDAANNYRLANYLLDLGLYRTAIFSARQVLTLAGMDDAATVNAPIYFNRIRFGTSYSDVVLPVTSIYGFEPLFFFSVLRQESLFEGFVTSTAGARGLMQIIPPTGASIAERLNWPPNYTDEDLYRPLVSITFGADYLDVQRDYFGGDIYAALAAYNGGPGNAAAWQELSGGDQDLFLEVIRFPETRTYIRRIYEIFNLYRRFYGAGQ